jgi:hypothetical protein
LTNRSKESAGQHPAKWYCSYRFTPKQHIKQVDQKAQPNQPGNNEYCLHFSIPHLLRMCALHAECAFYENHNTSSHINVVSKNMAGMSRKRQEMTLLNWSGAKYLKFETVSRKRTQSDITSCAFVAKPCWTRYPRTLLTTQWSLCVAAEAAS